MEPVTTYSNAAQPRRPTSNSVARQKAMNSEPNTTPQTPKFTRSRTSGTSTPNSEANMRHSGSDVSDFRSGRHDELLDDSTEIPKHSSSNRCEKRANKQPEKEKSHRAYKSDSSSDRSSSSSALSTRKYTTIQLELYQTRCYFIFAIVVALCITSAVILDNILSSPIRSNRIENLEERMNDTLKKLLLDFPDLGSKFKVLRVAIKTIVMGKPKQPAIVTLLASEGAEEATSCFARILAGAIESIFGEDKEFIHKSGHELREKLADPGRIKKHLDDAAMGGFNNGSRVFLLENFNVIPIESAMIFHGLCDDNNAPFKKVLFLFTVNLDDLGVSALKLNTKMFDVTSGWSKDLDENQLSSLESRIGTYKLLIESELKESLAALKKKCNR